MTPSSSPDRNLFPREDVSPNQDVSNLNRDTLSAIRELDKMIAETIETVFKYMSKSDDGDFDIVSRTGNNVLKVKKDVDAHFVDATTVAHMRVINTAAEANPLWRSAAATAITATPFILGGLVGLAI